MHWGNQEADPNYNFFWQEEAAEVEEEAAGEEVAAAQAARGEAATQAAEGAAAAPQAAQEEATASQAAKEEAAAAAQAAKEEAVAPKAAKQAAAPKAPQAFSSNTTSTQLLPQQPPRHMYSPANPNWRIGHVDSYVDSNALQSLGNLLSKQGLTKPELQEHYSAASGLRPFRDGIDIDAVFLSATDTIRDEICASRDIGYAEANVFAKYTVHTYLYAGIMLA